MEIVGTSVKKSTPEDKERIRALMHDDPHMFEAMAPRDLYKLLAAGEADIMLSGGRTQFIALKAKVPWLDINQERHNPYAGYDGIVELVRQIDLAIHNPVWEEVRTAAPWDDEGQLTVPHPAASVLTAPFAGENAGEDDPSKEELAAPAFVARHRKKFADTRVDNTDPNFLAHHRKKFAGAAGDDMGEC
jgi:nitrogenase molybdenum-cofactor synthesis protein NifE